MDYYAVCSALQPLRGSINVSAGGAVMSAVLTYEPVEIPKKKKERKLVQMLQFRALVVPHQDFCFGALSLKRAKLNKETKSPNSLVARAPGTVLFIGDLGSIVNSFVSSLSSPCGTLILSASLALQQ